MSAAPQLTRSARPKARAYTLAQGGRGVAWRLGSVQACRCRGLPLRPGRLADLQARHPGRAAERGRRPQGRLRARRLLALARSGLGQGLGRGGAKNVGLLGRAGVHTTTLLSFSEAATIGLARARRHPAEGVVGPHPKGEEDAPRGGPCQSEVGVGAVAGQGVRDASIHTAASSQLASPPQGRDHDDNTD